jgi:hypothetical protein
MTAFLSRRATALRVLRAVVGLSLVVGVVGACGGTPPPPPIPASVPSGLVPEKLHGDELAFYESESPSARDAFANAGEKSLAADGKLWELRKGDRLVGVLQLTTLVPEVDLNRKNHRNQVLKQLMPGVRDEILVDEVHVWTTEVDDKYTYLWFGEEMFGLLTVKPASEDQVDPERVLEEVVAYSLGSDKWEPLYIEEELEDL